MINHFEICSLAKSREATIICGVNWGLLLFMSITVIFRCLYCKISIFSLEFSTLLYSYYPEEICTSLAHAPRYRCWCKARWKWGWERWREGPGRGGEGGDSQLRILGQSISICNGHQASITAIKHQWFNRASDIVGLQSWVSCCMNVLSIHSYYICRLQSMKSCDK